MHTESCKHLQFENQKISIRNDQQTPKSIEKLTINIEIYAPTNPYVIYKTSKKSHKILEY